MSGKSSHEIDMLHGSILQKSLMFTIPMALSYLLQLLFNTADVVVVGRFAGSTALAAVGSTTSLVNMLVSFFVGISTGANIYISREYAAKRHDRVSDAVHTSVTMAILGGTGAMILALFLAMPILKLMKSPKDVIDLSASYLRIYYLGLPAIVLYNFGAAILRSIGDTKRPMYFLMISGILNVLLNLITVIVFGMGVRGVAIATTISNYLSMGLVIHALLTEESSLRLIPSRLCIRKKIMAEILGLGVPSGLQGSVFGLSNVMIQSAVNSFGSAFMAGNAASSSVEAFQYAFILSGANTATTFISQHIGARRYSRLTPIVRTILASTLVISYAVGILFMIFSRQLISIYNSDPAVIEVGRQRLILMCITAFLECCMDVFSFSCRGFGRTVEPMLVSLFGACVFRIIWLNTVFVLFPSYLTVIIVWPVSWLITATADILLFRKLRRAYPEEDM